MTAFRMWMWVLLLVPWPMVSCDVLDRDDEPALCKGDVALNAHGYWTAWWGQGSVFPPGYVEQAHADAVDRAALQLEAQYGWDPDYVRGVARSIEWILLDNCCFLSSDGVQWAAGEYLPACNRIILPIYRRHEGPCGSSPHVNAPPWTTRSAPWDPTLCRWGEIVAGDEYPATKHELGHPIAGPCFEHPNCNGNAELVLF